VNFKEYQTEVTSHPLYDNVIYGLIGEISEVVELVKKHERQGAKRQVMTHDRIEEELADILWYLTRACSEYGVDLETAAINNIKKLRKRHGIE